MTSNFDRFIFDVIKETAFADLPHKKPYGFWISPGGEAWPVNYEAHDAVALQLIEKIPQYKEKFDQHLEDNFIERFAIPKEAKWFYFNELGAVRCVFENDILWYSSVNVPSRKQGETLHDLALLYNSRLQHDK